MKRTLCFILFTCLSVLITNAQCAMCRAVLESEESQSAAEGINDGIVFLMAVPYILAAAIGYIIYRTYFKSVKTKKTE